MTTDSVIQNEETDGWRADVEHLAAISALATSVEAILI